jgi:hypothetical protein
MGLVRGLKPLRITLPVSVQLSSGSGAGGFPVDVSSSVEWVNLQALYDEYRFRGGVLVYSYVTSPGAAVPSAVTDIFHVVAWDSVDSTSLTSVRNGCELAQHKLTVPSTIVANGSTLTVTQNGPMNAEGNRFRFKVTKPILYINSSGNVGSAPGQWKELPTAGSNASPDGYIKCYSATGTSVGGTFGIFYMDVELRSRK